VRQEVARDVRGVDQEVAILDADVNVRAEDQQLTREVLHRVLRADVALERRDLLIGPVRERMRARGGDLEPASAGELHDAAPELHELMPHFGGRTTDRGPDLDDGLVQLGLHLPHHQVIVLEDLRDVGLKLTRLGIDDLVFLFDADGE
jgi:hypothetical protein